MQTSVAIEESSMEIHQKIKNGTVLWPSDYTSGNLSEETWVTVAKFWKQPKYLSVDELCKTMEHLYNGILLGCKKKKERERENFTLCDSMDGPREMNEWMTLAFHYAKWNKPGRERQIPYDFTNMWNLTNKLN